MSSRIYEIANKISEGKASEKDYLDFHDFLKGFINSYRFKEKIMNFCVSKFGEVAIHKSKNDKSLFKKELEVFENTAFEIVIPKIPNWVKSNLSKPLTEKKKSLFGYVRTILWNSVLGEINKEDPNWFLYLAMKKPLDGLEKSKRIESILIDKEKFYFTGSNSKILVDFKQLAWQDILKNLEFLPCKGRGKFRNPSPGQITELVPTVLDEIKQPLERRDLVIIFSFKFELHLEIQTYEEDQDDDSSADKQNRETSQQVNYEGEQGTFENDWKPTSNSEFAKIVIEEASTLIIERLIAFDDKSFKIKLFDLLLDFLIWANLPLIEGGKFTFEKYYKNLAVDKDTAKKTKIRLEVFIRDLFLDKKSLIDPSLFPEIIKYLRKEYYKRKPKFIEDLYS